MFDGGAGAVDGVVDGGGGAVDVVLMVEVVRGVVQCTWCNFLHQYYSQSLYIEEERVNKSKAK